MYVTKNEIQVWILKSKFLHSRREKLRYQKSIQKRFWKKSNWCFLGNKQANKTTKQNKNLQEFELQNNTTHAGYVQNSQLIALCTYIGVNCTSHTRLKFVKHFKFVLEYSLFTINEKKF